MTGMDWAIVGFIALSSVLAAAQGFFQEIFGLAGAIIGYLLAAWEYHRAAGWFEKFFSAAWMADVAGFLTIFFACLLFAGAIGRICRWLFKEVGLAWFDRLLGAAFGVVRGVVIVTVVLMGFVAFAPGSPLVAKSELSQYFLALGQGASWVGPGSLRSQLRQNLAKLAVAVEKPAAADAGEVKNSRGN